MVTILLPMEMQEMGVLSLSQKIPRIRKWQPTPVFLPGKSHGHRSLAGYSPWGRRVGHALVTERAHSVLHDLQLLEFMGCAETTDMQQPFYR